MLRGGRPLRSSVLFLCCSILAAGDGYPGHCSLSGALVAREGCCAPPDGMPTFLGRRGMLLRLRGAGKPLSRAGKTKKNPTKTVDKARALEMAVKGIQKVRKRRYKAGTKDYMPFAGPRLYAIGGRSGKTDLAAVHIFDAKDEQWEIGRAIDERRASASAVGVLGKIYVLGGVRGGIRVMDEVECFDPKSINTSWVQETIMPVARRCFAACEMAGGIYLLGGAGKVVFGDRRRNDESFVSVQRYSPGSKSWSNVTDLPLEVRHHAAASLGGRIYCIGGWRGNVGWQGYGSTVGEVWSWAPGEEEWRAEEPLPTPRRDMQAVAVGGRIYAVGGFWQGNQVDVVESFCPLEGKWRSEKALEHRRSSFAAAAFNGKIYAAGGIVGGAELGTVEVFDPRGGGNWSEGPKLPARRWALCMAAA